MMSPEAVVDLQIEAFNRGDADAFAAFYAEHAEISYPLSGDTPVHGREAIRDHYTAMFTALPNLRASVAGRLVVGNVVTIHEHIPGIGAEAVATYAIVGGQISRAWLFGPIPTTA